MFLSQDAPESAARTRRCADDGRRHARHHRGHVRPAIEAVLHLGQIALRILGQFERMMSAGQSRFQIPEQDVKPSERLDFRPGLALGSDHCLVHIAQFP